MQAIRHKNTKEEVLLAKALWKRGIRYRRNDSTVFGKPDFTFKGKKVAVFVDGEFFHGYNWETEKFRIKTNREFWWNKIEGNIARDQQVCASLISSGWRVIRFWSKDVRQNIERCTNDINIILMNKMISYTELKEKLKIKVEKHLNDGFASLTHHWQNRDIDRFENNYQTSAQAYYQEQFSPECQEPEQLYIPFHYDVPFPPVKDPRFSFIDLFAGIGGIRLAFQRLGGKCVFSSEWDKYARMTYEANFGEVPFGDIRNIHEATIPDHDVLLAGFPCQPFSIAGVSKKNALGRAHGFLDETQGTLFFDIARIIKHKKPSAFMLENVKNLVSHDKGRTFKIIEGTLKELGYAIKYKVLDSQYFVPQHRERILIIGIRDDLAEKHTIAFSNQYGPESRNKLADILEDAVEDKYILSDKLWDYLQRYSQKHKEKGNGFGYGLADINGITRTLSARYYKDGSEILIPQQGINPRRLTPRECARLQGFPDSFIIPVSDNQAYKQFGNSVSVPLIQYAGQLFINKLFPPYE